MCKNFYSFKNIRSSNRTPYYVVSAISTLQSALLYPRRKKIMAQPAYADEYNPHPSTASKFCILVFDGRTKNHIQFPMITTGSCCSYRYKIKPLLFSKICHKYLASIEVVRRL
uniref:Uncharacterized protein n=1 Tax=Parascaris univalens TaxID=6257 RepID=A0A915CEE2_PARUN